MWKTIEKPKVEVNNQIKSILLNKPVFIGIGINSCFNKRKATKWIKQGYEDNWFCDSPNNPITPRSSQQNTQSATKPIDMGSNDITNDPEFKKMFGKSEVVNNESDSSDSHTKWLRTIN